MMSRFKNYFKEYQFVSADGTKYTRYVFPSMSYTYNSEGDVTFNTKDYGDTRVPRKIKKWVRKELGWGLWQPYWTNHNTRTKSIGKGIL